MIQHRWTFLFLLAWPGMIFSQEATELQVPDSVVKDMHTWRDSLFQAVSVDERLRYNDSLQVAVEDFLDLPEAFERGTDTLKYFGDLYSPDGAFRLLTWNVPLEEDKYAYFCYVLKKDGSWVQLIDNKSASDRLETRTLDHTNWYGALYYQIIPFKHQRENHYLLLGWDGYGKLSTRKLIEVMYFDKKGLPRFGKGVFRVDKRVKRRIVLEFKKDAAVTLRYLPDHNWIVFNHLEPLRPELEGLYEFYAPDLSFDAFSWKKGEWVLLEAVDMFTGKSDKPYRDPRKTRQEVPENVPERP